MGKEVKYVVRLDAEERVELQSMCSLVDWWQGAPATTMVCNALSS